MTTETINSSTASNSASRDNYKVDIHFPTIDVILTKIRDRLRDINVSLMKSIDCLNPKSKNFLKADLLIPLLDQYHKSLPTSNLLNEIMTFRNSFERNPIPEDKKTLVTF